MDGNLSQLVGCGAEMLMSFDGAKSPSSAYRRYLMGRVAFVGHVSLNRLDALSSNSDLI